MEIKEKGEKGEGRRKHFMQNYTFEYSAFKIYFLNVARRADSNGILDSLMRLSAALLFKKNDSGGGKQLLIAQIIKSLVD